MSDNKNDHIDDAVKGAFASSSKKAPSNLWSAIDDKINPESTVVDSSVKKSFDSLNHAVPEEIWGGINKQLNIDTVWSRLNAYLNSRTRRRLLWFRWRIAMLMLLLIGGSASIFFWPESIKDESTNEPSLVGYKFNITKTNEATLDSEEKQSLSSSSDGMSNPSTRNNGKLAIVNEGAKSRDAAPRLSQNAQQPEGTMTVKTGHKNKLAGQRSKYLAANMKDTHYSTNSRQSPQTPSDSQTNDDIKNIVKIDTSLIILAAIPVRITLDSIPMRPFDTASVNANPGWTYGVYANPFYGVLWNNESRNGIMASSLISLKPSISWSAGADITYYIDDNSFLDFRLGATQYNQVVGNYRLGHYFEKRSTVNLVSGVVSYGLNKPLKGNKNNLLSLSAGLGLDLLVNGTNTYSDEKSIDEVFYKSINPLMSLSIGNIKHHDRFELEYGLRSNIGLLNIFAGDKFLPSDFNVTRTFGIGPYLAFRIASSKKSK